MSLSQSILIVIFLAVLSLVAFDVHQNGGFKGEHCLFRSLFINFWRLVNGIAISTSKLASLCKLELYISIKFFFWISLYGCIHTTNFKQDSCHELMCVLWMSWFNCLCVGFIGSTSRKLLKDSGIDVIIANLFSHLSSTFTIIKKFLIK